MKISITTRRCELTDEMKNRATLEVGKLDKFFDNIISANLVLSQDNFRFDGELTMSVSRSKLVAKSSTEDWFATVEDVTDKMARQLKKHKGKMKDHKVKKAGERKARVKLSTKEEEVEF